MSKKQWKACCILTFVICCLWMKWGSDHHTVEYDKLNDENKTLINSYEALNNSYEAEQKIVDQMEQVIVQKNLEIDELNAQIKELKEVK